MEGKASSEQPSLEDNLWWTSPDEEYWRALLEQGRIAPEINPPPSPQDFGYLQTGGSPGSRAAASRRTDGDEQTDSNDEWRLARLALEQGDTFRLNVSGVNRGGLLVQWNGMQGFVPASQLSEIPQDRDPHERMSTLARRVGTSLTLRLIEVDEAQDRLVFSQRTAGSGAEAPGAILSTLSPGEVCRGTVTNLTTFGAFVDMGGV